MPSVARHFGNAVEPAFLCRHYIADGGDVSGHGRYRPSRDRLDRKGGLMIAAFCPEWPERIVPPGETGPGTVPGCHEIPTAPPRLSRGAMSQTG